MKTLFKVISGSRAYGTNLPESDVDIKSIYQQPNSDILTFGYKEQIDISKDETHYEIRRFLELLSTANPSMIEILFSDEECIIERNNAFDIILENRDKFLTKQCRNSFLGYAIGQLKRARGLNKKVNWEQSGFEKRKNPIDFCYVVIDNTTRVDSIKQGVYPLVDWLVKHRLSQDKVYVNKLNHTREGYQLYLGEEGGIVAEDSTKLKTPSSPPNRYPIATVLYNADAYTQHCKDFESYQVWLKERNEQRYIDYKGQSSGYDLKNIMHTRRLINMAFEIVQEKTVRVRRPEAAQLLKIRRGEIELENLLAEAEANIKKLDELFNNSDLPKNVDPNLKQELLLQIREISV